jgi:hypothetical protein
MSVPEVASLAHIMVELRRRITPHQLPEKRLMSNRSAIVESVSSLLGSQVAETVYRALKTRILAETPHTTGCRARQVYPLTDSEQSWLLLEWVEGNTDVICIFDIKDEADHESCSWLLHCRTGKTDSEATSSSLHWSVTDISVLKTLFQVAQHVLGILEMPKEDAIQLYCESNEECSIQE